MQKIESLGSSLRRFFDENPALCVGADTYDVCVSTNVGAKLDNTDAVDQLCSFGASGNDAHLYIHIPLCEFICHFCNYVKKRISQSDPSGELSQWVELIIAESEIYLRRMPWAAATTIRSFYIGGGTGGLLLSHRPALERLMAHFRGKFHFSPDCEFCIEGNPNNFNDDTLKLALDLGFNRFSVGVQTLHEDVNGYARRSHSAEDARKAIEALRRAGKPFNVDMMFGLPLQTVESVALDVRELMRLEVPSVSIYRLRNSEREIGNSSIWNKQAQRLQAGSPEVVASTVETYRQRRVMTDILAEHGYQPAPCGWWNKAELYPDGNIPRVSKDKWEMFNTMLAFGPGAYGWVNGSDGGILQYYNTNSISDYIAHMKGGADVPPVAFGRKLEGAAAIGTKLTFAFKANRPIRLGDYRRRFGVDLLKDAPYAAVLSELRLKNFIEISPDGTEFRPTLLGEEFHEEIVYEYFRVKLGILDDCACA